MRRSYKNEEFDWLFDFVTVTWKNNRHLAGVLGPYYLGQWYGHFSAIT